MSERISSGSFPGEPRFTTASAAGHPKTFGPVVRKYIRRNLGYCAKNDQALFRRSTRSRARERAHSEWCVLSVRNRASLPG